MTAPLHERLEALADETRLDAADMGCRGRHVRCRELLDHAAMLDEAAAALRPPEGEVGALCERLGRGFEDAGEFTVVVDKADLRAALAHLRPLAAVEAELKTRTVENECMQASLRSVTEKYLARALAPAPAAESAR